MEAGMLPLVISFLFGGALIRCFEVCPLWFVVYYKTLDQVFSKIDKGFKQYYGQSLHLEYARTDWSPVHVAEAGIRIDRILIARVTSHHVNHCTKVSYGYAYKSGQFAEDDNDVAKTEDRKDPFECSFKFDTYTRGRSRNFWIHKDICRFHGDETRVAATQNITPVCVNDRIEIAVNLFNAMGLVDVDKVGWRPLEIFPMQDRECPIEQELFDWYDLDSFQSQSVERLQIPDFFSPQLMHMSTEYAGIDVAVSRTRLRAEAQGVVPQADRILGSRFEVLPRSSPIILPLKRVGLQHDRFTKIQLRQGDCILLCVGSRHLRSILLNFNEELSESLGQRCAEKGLWPPQDTSPQLTTEPSPSRAAKALEEAYWMIRRQEGEPHCPHWGDRVHESMSANAHGDVSVAMEIGMQYFKKKEAEYFPPEEEHLVPAMFSFILASLVACMLPIMTVTW
ncbi:unnamed protein product [Symbiodinium sp. CCMP2592]|nr:unnamed protein product [Symbiodinium sp. CCMP2592]